MENGLKKISYNEEMVPDYTLPAPLLYKDGTKVTDSYL